MENNIKTIKYIDEKLKNVEINSKEIEDIIQAINQGFKEVKDRNNGVENEAIKTLKDAKNEWVNALKETSDALNKDELLERGEPSYNSKVLIDYYLENKENIKNINLFEEIVKEESKDPKLEEKDEAKEQMFEK